MSKILREHTALRRGDTYSLSGPPPSTRNRRGPGTPIPPMLLFSGCFLAGVWFNMSLPWAISTAADQSVPVIVGALLVSAGLVVFGVSLRTFARARTGIMLQHAATLVVDHGPYALSRNPMYVSFVATYVGACLLVNTLWPLLLLPVVIVVMNRVVIAREERYMRLTFPIPYGAYARRVRRWI